MDVALFSKREIFLRDVGLSGVNLDQVAEVVARELGVKGPGVVVVVDARDDLLTLDVLDEKLDIERIAGRRQSLLDALALIPGLEIRPETQIHSEGVLGLLNLSRQDAETLAPAVAAIGRDVRSRVARRAVVLPTGSEIIAGQIVDTNTPFLLEILRSEGFVAEGGPAVADDVDAAMGALVEAASKGYGLVVTTGGTGAETKDCIVDAIKAIDPSAATPYVVHYRRGQGRHAKDGVRLAVGCLELTTYVALTGPHREVRLVAPILMHGLREEWSKERLSGEMAGVLREELVRRGGAPAGAVQW
jgi:hypothetical protein